VFLNARRLAPLGYVIFGSHDPPIPSSTGPLEAFRRSKTMFAAMKLGVFDRLEERPPTPARWRNNSART